MITKSELAIQAYLASRELEFGQFTLRVIHAKRINKIACIKEGIKLWKGAFEVTPQEELFAQFFNSEKSAIADMTILELRAHREELAKIAFEARARLTAVDDEERSRRAKAKKESGPTGFSTSLQTDELTSDAINRIKERQKKLTKQEKLVEQLVKLGMDRKDAEAKVSAGTILARLKSQQIEAKPADVIPVVNPFAPKTDNVAQATEVTIQEETNTVIITKEEEPKSKPAFVNPFAK